MGVIFEKVPRPLVFSSEIFDITVSVPYLLAPPEMALYNCTTFTDALLVQHDKREENPNNPTPPRTATYIIPPRSTGTGPQPPIVVRPIFGPIPTRPSLLDVNSLRDLASNIDDMYDAAFAEAMAVFHSTTRLLTDPFTNVAPRPKRYSIQSFGGAGSSGFFGIALNSQIDAISTHLLSLDAWANQQDDFQNKKNSIVSNLAWRQLEIMENLNKQKSSFENVLTNITAQFETWSTYLNTNAKHESRDLHLHTQLTQAFFGKITEILSLYHYTRHYTSFSTTLRQLHTSTFPADLLSPSDVTALYSTARSYLTLHFPQMTDLILDKFNVYTAKPSLVLYTNNSLHIHFALPIIHPQHVFDLFHVRIFPIPFRTDQAASPGYTQLNLKYTHFAINSDKSFMELQTADFSQCEMAYDLQLCPNYLPIKTPSLTTCLTSLWNNNMSTTYSKCQFKAFPLSNLASTSYHIDDDLFAVSFSDDTYSLTCPPAINKTIKAPCAFCFIRVPCGCAIKTQSLEISGLLANCKNTSSITVPFFTLNLPLAFAFNMSTLNLQSDFTYEQPIILNLPNISAALAAVHTFGKEDLAHGLDLSQMADAIAQVDLLKTGINIPVFFQELANNPLVTVTLLLLHVLTLIGLSYLLYKYRSLARLGPIMSSHNPVMAALIPSPTPREGPLIIRGEQHPTRPTINTNITSAQFDLAEYQAHLIAAVLTFTILALLWKLFRFVITSLTNYYDQESVPINSCSHLKLKLSDGVTAFIIPLIHLETESDQVQAISFPRILNICTKSNNSCITLSWSHNIDLHISNQPITFTLPVFLNVSFKTKLTVKRWLKQRRPWTYHFVICKGKQISELPLLPNLNNYTEDNMYDYEVPTPSVETAAPTNNPFSPSTNEPHQVLLSALRKMANDH